MANFILLAFAAMTIVGGGAPAGDDGSRPSPIRLAVERGEHDVLLHVVGLTDTACTANYSLEVSGGGNRSSQRGTARLRPNTPVTLARLKLASSGERGWSAKLSVDSCNGEHYEQHVPSN